MARRITAFIGMVAILLLVLILIWRVYLHHTSGVSHDEPTVVELASPPAPPLLNA